MPPRSEQLFKSTSSSFPSRTVVLSTTIIFVALSTKNWNNSLAFMNDIKFFLTVLFTLLTYVTLSLTRIYLGGSFPSDCLLSLGPITLVLAFHYLLSFWLFDFIKICPVCDDKNFCYQQSDPGLYNLITRENFDFWHLNGEYAISIMLIALFLFTFLSIKPIELWHKTTYFFASSLAILLFQTTMLCPRLESGYYTSPSPSTIEIGRDSFQMSIIISLLLFSFLVTFLINSLLAKRTGPALSYFLRIVFFGTITFMTYIALITVRLLIIQQSIKI